MKTIALLLALNGAIINATCADEVGSAVVRSLMKENRRALASPVELGQLEVSDFEFLRKAFEKADLLKQTVLALPLATLNPQEGLGLLAQAVEKQTRASMPLDGKDQNRLQLLLQAIGYIAQGSEEAAKYLSDLLTHNAWSAYRGSIVPNELDALLASFTLKAYAVSGRADVTAKIKAFARSQPLISGVPGVVVDAAFFDWYGRKYGSEMLNDRLLSGDEVHLLIPLFFNTSDGKTWKKWFDKNNK